MKKTLFYIFIVLSSFKTLLAQDVIIIEAFVLDKNTNAPLPYVNIGFLEKGVGTVSDENGKFLLKYDEDYIEDFEVLQFSSLGYETLKIKASELFSKLSKTNKIYLEPKGLNLDEVVITSQEREQKQVGSLGFDGNSIGYWKEDIALGGEIATKVRINNKNSRLLDLKLRILENISDSLKLRINIYDSKKRLPHENLLNSNVFHIVKKSVGIDTINLKPYNIKVDDDIIVSIELIEVFGNQVGFAIAGTKKFGTTYTRYISQDKWEQTKDVKMSFSLLTSYPKSKGNDALIERKAPKEITLFWDNSSSMQLNRNINKEIDFITAYLNNIKNVSINVVKFGSQITSTKKFEIAKGNSILLIDYLKNTNYDGATNFSNILLDNTLASNTAMLFSDGFVTLSNFEENIKCPVFCISSSANANHNMLQNISFNTDAHYINLEQNTIQIALKFLQFQIEDKTIYKGSDNLESEDNIYGKVFDKSGPIQGASITKKGTYIEVLTNKEGIYKIPANYGDVLVVNYFGEKPKEVIVSNKKNIDIKLEFEGELLEAINIKGSKRKTDSLSRIVRDKDRKYGYAASYLEEENINQADIYLTDVLRKMPGVNVSGFGTNAKVWLRDKKVEPAIYVDGFQNLNYLSLPPQNISSVVVYRSLAAINRFGSEAAGGAILITTKTGKIRGKIKKLKNWALLTDNDYNKEKLLLETNTKTSQYINELYGASSFNDALNIYKNQKSYLKQPSIPFYFDASDYFTRWDKNIAFTILSSIAEIAFNNVKALKTLAYKLEELNKFEEAKFIYQRILELSPKQAQSYRDLALIYQSTGQYNEAMLLYKQMLLGVIKDVDFSNLNDVIINEIRHLVLLHKSKVDYKDLPADLLRIDFKQDMRFVLEWNNPLVEFEIQFVNPKNKYYTWEHSVFENKEQLLDEIEKGNFTKEFFIDDAEEGKWIINIKSLNKEALLNPTYLKYTVYKNYCKPSEAKTVRVIKLFEQQEKGTLDELVYKH